ncbi:hypothetical protein QEH59_18490 [Coraliomargarita sp. SDUM461004]|uniref:PEP-CTERM protein-sorting domain-containing protein n=1 Tax=Thalassobacterium sedimentorum TaxID=3041258 RepID=A0ABU1ANU9_9BACT|nr:hypothetical protein [Coraliomargarita sp. SDUM461004]MDQ8196424.1 hypothetical protein [Coraliomargarita sp. SDUM461004]
MKNPIRFSPSLALMIASLGASLSAQDVLLNFGGNYAGTNAPGHDAGLLTGTNWNSVSVDTASGIVDQVGAATSVSLDFGLATAEGGTTVNYALSTKSAPYAMNAGVDADLQTLFNTSLGLNNVVRDGSGNLGVAVSLSGLAAGEYRYFLTAFRGDAVATSTRDFDIYAGVSADAITDFSSYSAGSITNSAGVSGWTAGDNYLSGTFTIDGINDTFSLLSNSTNFIGVFTSLEIAVIPESSAFALLGGLFVLGLAAVRRRCN